MGCRLLFVSSFVSVVLDNEGNTYLNHHINRNAISRYANLTDDFRMMIKDSGIRLSRAEAEKQYDRFPFDLADLVVCPNPYRPRINIINLKLRRKIRDTIRQSIAWADKVVIATTAGPYVEYTVRFCKEMNKPWLHIVEGYAFESIWYHSLAGKLTAYKYEQNLKCYLREATFALYVTKYELQKRYPCAGITLGCSDVVIYDRNLQILEERLKRIRSPKKTLTIGTVGSLDVRIKGQAYVIRALARLKREGKTQFRYAMLGDGTGKQLRALAKRLDVEDMVVFAGKVPHDQVYLWLDSVDIYIQPSITEGLCRAIVEAMSRGCTVIATNVGGNPELLPSDRLIAAKKPDEIYKAILQMSDPKVQEQEARKNFEKAGEYEASVLDQERMAFLRRFMEH